MEENPPTTGVKVSIAFLLVLFFFGSSYLYHKCATKQGTVESSTSHAPSEYVHPGDVKTSS